MRGEFRMTPMSGATAPRACVRRGEDDDLAREDQARIAGAQRSAVRIHERAPVRDDRAIGRMRVTGDARELGGRDPPEVVAGHDDVRTRVG